jgi:hypothetical protein
MDTLSYGQNGAHPEQMPLQLATDLTFDSEVRPVGVIMKAKEARQPLSIFCSDLKPVRWGSLVGLLYFGMLPYPGMQLNPLERHIYLYLKGSCGHGIIKCIKAR